MDYISTSAPGMCLHGFVSAAATAVVKTTVIKTLDNADFTCRSIPIPFRLGYSC